MKAAEGEKAHCTFGSLLVNDDGASGSKFEGDRLMNSMQDREKAFEAKFALDEELRFRAVARRNKLLGLWAAGLLAKSDPEAYAREIVAADFEEAGHEDVVRKIKADFDAAGVAISDDDIRLRMVELLSEAVTQVQKS
ncbi:hypothetical protein ACVI1N_000518 [Sinorhizobium medicae]